MEEAPTTATRATLRDILQAQVAALELAPKWLWEIEFALHIWPILERFHRDRDPTAEVIVSLIRKTNNVSAGVRVLTDYLGPNRSKDPPPW